MQLSPKQIFSLSVLGTWLLSWFLDPVRALISLNFETWATEHGYQNLYKLLPDWLMPVWEYIGVIWRHATGELGLGFAAGAVIFAFWDPIARHGNHLFRIGG